MPVSSMAFVAYPVSDVPKAVEFYKDVLGLKTTEFATPFWVEFDVAGSTFGVGNFEQLGKAGTAQALAFEVEDLPGFRAGLDAKGVGSTEPFETPVCFISVLKDPDGNQIILHAAKAR